MILIINNPQKKTSSTLSALTTILEKEDLSYKILCTEKLQKSFFNQITLIITLGGDGTILRAFSKMTIKSIPLLPIDFGTLGFISSVPPKQALKLIKNYLTIHFKNKPIKPLYKFDQRHYLQVTIDKLHVTALNEITLHRTQSKVVETEIWINNKFISRFKGDGLILATATGSTAYNLSAGGPIINPNIPNIILTPLAPHSITFKPILLKKEDQISIKIPTKTMQITVDGRKKINKFKSNSITNITANISNQSTKFIKEKNEDFYSLLKEKFSWGME